MHYAPASNPDPPRYPAPWPAAPPPPRRARPSPALTALGCCPAAPAITAIRLRHHYRFHDLGTPGRDRYQCGF